MWQLLRRIGYRSGIDRLRFVGDLVNRGPASLEALRWIAAEQAQGHVRVVLGNHDLHLIGLALGVAPKRPNKGLAEILSASDGEALVDWLRHQPLLLEESALLYVHAGLLPAWTVEDALAAATDLSNVLAGFGAADLLRESYTESRTPRVEALAALTRIRMVDGDGVPDYHCKGSPEQAPAGLKPWFDAGHWPTHRIVFGHWAALGLRVSERAVGLDSGCVWGGALTAFRVEDGAIYSVPRVSKRAK